MYFPSYYGGHFFYTNHLPTQIYTLSLHDALPISAADTCNAWQWSDFWSASARAWYWQRSEEHTSELQSLRQLVCRLLLEKKKRIMIVRSRDSRLGSYSKKRSAGWYRAFASANFRL